MNSLPSSSKVAYQSIQIVSWVLLCHISVTHISRLRLTDSTFRENYGHPDDHQEAPTVITTPSNSSRARTTFGFWDSTPSYLTSACPLADAADVRRSEDAKNALILVSVHLLRIAVANHTLWDGALTTNHERTPQADLVDFPDQTKILLQSPQVLSSLLNLCPSRNWLTPSPAAVQPSAHLTQAVPPHPKIVKESDKYYPPPAPQHQPG